MFSERMKCLLVLLLCLMSCSPARRLENMRSGRLALSLSVPQEEPEQDSGNDVVIDSIRSTLSDGPLLMNAIRDSESGEMVATDVISASKVTARFRNVAERQGWVSIEFDLTVPPGMSDSRWQLKIHPVMTAAGDTSRLEPVYITGKDYRAAQLKGYQRYRNFIASIVTDTTDLLRMNQLEIFLKRNFPQTYAMKTDSSIVREPLASDLFGVTRQEALRHYTKHLKQKINDGRKARKDRMFDRYVKDPIVREGIRLDTVLVGQGGEFTYRYVHTFQCRKRLRKAVVRLDGALYEDGQMKLRLPLGDSLTYYISSLSTLVDNSPKYRMTVLERVVYDNTKALIDFGKGSSSIDTLLGDNASELKRIRRCIDDVVSRDDLCLDSLVVTASCSPEGSYSRNRALSQARSCTMKDYICAFVPDGWKGRIRTSALPENWEQFRKLVASDTLMGDSAKKRILDMTERMADPDVLEAELSSLPQYRYLREKIYPKLRSVRFDFHLHRAGMQKDTVHTTELDTTYMEGVRAMEELDYKKAVRLLRPYEDYNAALALMAADYNNTALDVLDRLDEESARVCYLKAVILSRLEVKDEAFKYLELSIAYDPRMAHRANLDPELHELAKQMNTNNENDHE
ncbi:MAG: tetratricopeptide repeat protein [Candidatus Cryptobacteroides sp.]